MTHRKEYKKKHSEVKGIIEMLGSRFGSMGYKGGTENTCVSSKLRSMVEVCPNNICGHKVSCVCGGYSESDVHIEKIEELEDYILELREQIVKLQKENQADRESENRAGPESVLKSASRPHLEGIDLRVSKSLHLLERENARLRNVSKEVCKNTMSLRNSLVSSRDMLGAKEKRLSELELLVKKYEKEVGRIPLLEEEVEKGICREKKLRNDILDLKGSIRVFCRIRPTFADSEEICDVKSSLEDITLSNPVGCGKKDLSFRYDRIFGEVDAQENVFEEVSPLICSGMDGYKICIFAYGQTGSGKTYTMEGQGMATGIIQRSIDKVFDIVSDMEGEGWAFQFTANVVEIYNENIKDLLSADEKKVEIRQLGDEMVLSNCVEHAVKDRNEVLSLLEIARRNRSVGATQSNEGSSRSHSVFTFKVKMSNPVMKEHRDGVFNFVDLAGSERLNVSKVEGERLKETQNINKSLSVLGNVMTALAKKEQHVPFRDSKLTFLLKEYLQGNARVLMFVNIAAEKRHYGETICSLRFASKVSECKFGPAQRSLYRQTCWN